MKYLKSPKIILLIILLLGLFLRIYKLEIFYPWGHDQDLFAWIAKDIVVDHHFRLIGQETSIIGVFISPLFYYLVALSFALFNMNPLSAALVTTIVSLLTIVSIYYVFSKFFNRNAGLIGAFLYAVLPGTVFLDRWVVPTQPTILWSVWFLYILLSVLNGNFKILIPLSILIGLVLHIHIAFIPLLLLLPVAYWFSSGPKSIRFKYSLKTLTLSLLIIFILITPFVFFEIRHGFSQTRSLFSATYKDTGDLTGIKRLSKVVNSGGRSLAGAFVLSNTVIGLPPLFTSFLPFLLLGGIFYLWRRQLLSKKQTMLFICWYLIVFLGQFFSKRIITEYYFNNLFVILFLIVAIYLALAQNSLRKFPLIPLLCIIYATGVVVWFINRPDDLGGYLYKREVVEYIKLDSLKRGYPCVAINFIEGQVGKGNGYRYLFWLNNLKIVTAGNDLPVYSIVNPWTLSEKEISAKLGNMGIIVPVREKTDPNVCNKADRQLLPLWGFNN